jgi:peptidoglycan hydrolase-like protein with peptidoglycan-binding domain
MRILAMAIFAAVAGGTTLVAAPTAPAVALPTCNRTAAVNSESGGAVDVPSAGRHPAGTNCAMGRGTIGRAVGLLQLNLNVCYQERLALDGRFGPTTEAALKRAQAREGAKVNGVYGPQTRNLMRWAGGNPWGCWRVDNR